MENTQLRNLVAAQERELGALKQIKEAQEKELTVNRISSAQFLGQTGHLPELGSVRVHRRQLRAPAARIISEDLLNRDPYRQSNLFVPHNSLRHVCHKLCCGEVKPQQSRASGRSQPTGRPEALSDRGARARTWYFTFDMRNPSTTSKRIDLCIEN